MTQTIWERIVAKKYYVVFVIAPTFVWLWGSVLAMFSCSVRGPPFHELCKAAFWAAGAATPFHVFTAHLFICMIYPKNILIDRHEAAGSKRLTYGFVFLAPFVAPLGVLCMFFASSKSEHMAVRLPLFLLGMLFLATVGYVPLAVMFRAKRRSDRIKAVNNMKMKGFRGAVSVVSSDVTPVTSYKMLNYKWWEHPFLYMYTEGGAVVDYVNELMTHTWLYDAQIGRDAFNMHHTGLVVQELHWVCNRRLWSIYKQKRDDDINATANQTQDTAKRDLTARIIDSVITQNVRGTSSQHGSSRVDETAAMTQGPLPLRDDEVYLFHGTKKRFARSIIEEGLDVRKSRDGLYGRGIYLTESSQKADQYSDSPHKRKRKALTMLVVRTRLGAIKEWNENGPFAATDSDKPFDTLVAGYDKRFREFIVTDSAHCYPEFLVVYKREFEGGDID